MNIRKLTFAAFLASSLCLLPSCETTSLTGPVGSLSSILAPATSSSQSSASLNGIIFKNYPYTTLKVKATSSRYSDEGVYDYTVTLRFHRDSNRVQVKVTGPNENMTDGGTYSRSLAKALETNAKVSYTSDLDMIVNVKSVGTVTSGKKCKVRLTQSSYTYSTGGGAKLFGYDFAESATIEGSNN